MLPEFSAEEARVIGCLIEKSVITPDQYPLTLNALTNACNQKSSRDPVMKLTPGEVQRAVRKLEEKHLVRVEESFRSGVQKHTQRFCNTRYSDYQFDDAQLAIICLLLLRGPQTPGELRARSGRLHTFEDNAAVVTALTTLVQRDGDPLVVKLPRTPGRKDSEYMHVFCGPVAAATDPPPAAAAKPPPPSRLAIEELTERVATLEEQVAELKRRLG